MKLVLELCCVFVLFWYRLDMANVSFVKNQPAFHPIGFNPVKEQWQFAVVMGGENFDYRGGLWAFVPSEIKRPSLLHHDRETGAREVSFNPRDAIRKALGRGTRLEQSFRMIEQNRIKIGKNWNDPDVRKVVSIIGQYNRPTAAGFFYCLLSDLDAGEMTFHDYCRDFGGNSDSIKEQQQHQACQANARKFRAVVTTEEIEKLREALENY